MSLEMHEFLTQTKKGDVKETWGVRRDSPGQEVQKSIRNKRDAPKWVCKYNTREQKKLRGKKFEKRVDN